MCKVMTRGEMLCSVGAAKLVTDGKVVILAGGLCQSLIGTAPWAATTEAGPDKASTMGVLVCILSSHPLTFACGDIGDKPCR
jgi:hypothetical protein